MTRTLYLHTGVQRTATTSLQGFLFRNSRALMKRGLFYPYRVRRHSKLVNRMMPLTGAGEAKRRPVPAVAREIERLAQGKPHELHSVVLSDEALSLRRDLSPLAAFREHFDVKVILVMRRQDLWLESFYQQNVKWQWNPELAHVSFEEFLERRSQFHWINYDARVAMLEEVFGADNVELVVFEKDSMPGGPVTEICRRMGLEDLEGLSAPPHDNASLSPPMVELTRHLPLDEMPLAARKKVLAVCKEVDESAGRRSGRLLTPERREQLLEDYAPGNARLARRRFGGETLFTDPLPDPEAPVGPLEIPSESAELLTEFIAPMLLRLGQPGRLAASGATKPTKGAKAAKPAGRAKKAGRGTSKP